jgi:pyruvoyl-dependent arginine decarboxylase
MILGNRIPYEYFLTNGHGDSDAGSEGLPYETGSYDQALTNAGIQNVNVIEYTSVIPTGAKEISKEEGLARIKWGEVMECIKAQKNGERGSFISAAVMTTSVYNPSGKYLGGFACEYSGSGDRKSCEKSLTESIVGIIERRGLGNIIGECKMYSDNFTDKGYKFHPGKNFVYDSLHVKKHHGSVFSAICFISYLYPSSTFKKSTFKKSTFRKGRAKPATFKKSTFKKSTFRKGLTKNLLPLRKV